MRGKQAFSTGTQHTAMRGLSSTILLSVLLVSSGLAQDHCTSVETIEKVRQRLQKQLDDAKAELDTWQNQTQFMQCQVTAGTCTADEMKQIADTLYNKIQQELQQNHNDLKIEIHQLINRTSARELDTSALGTVNNPATSCRHIARINPSSLPGYKTIRTPDGETHIMYCTLQVPCSGDVSGWTRVAFVDMTDPDQSCPPGLRQIETPKRSCARFLNRGGCNSVTFTTHGLAFNKVCGRVIGYQFGSPSGFYTPSSGSSIDGPYLDGISLTHGQSPRQHIWSFANALEETAGHEGGRHVCPCSNPSSTMQSYIPSFVGKDYFCDSGIHTGWRSNVYYDSDPLWDGQGCEAPSTCCTFNSPPWFHKQLPQPTNSNMELRICADQDALHDEDSPVELIELYVQ